MNWPWTRPRQDPDRDTRLRDIEDRLHAVERGLKEIDLEWSKMYDQFRRLLMKLAKRDQRASADAETTNGDGAGGSRPHETTNPLAAALLANLRG